MFKVNPLLAYNNVGSSGLVVSSIGFRNGGRQPKNYQDQRNIIKKALELGINFYETPNSEKHEQCEEIYGKIFKDLDVAREHAVIAIRMMPNKYGQVNFKSIKQNISSSLTRLQMQYADIIYAQDANQSQIMDEICQAYHEIIEEGKVFYWVTSDWDADQVLRAFQICQKKNYHKPIASYSRYNMLCRKQVQYDYRKLLEKHNYGLIAHDTLVRGFFSDKFQNKQETKDVKNVRQNHSISQFTNEQAIRILTKLREYCKNDLNCQVNQLAVAWILKFRYLSSVIIGAKSEQQLVNNFKILETLKSLTSTKQQEVNKIIQCNIQSKLIDFKSWKKLPSIRNQHEIDL